MKRSTYLVLAVVLLAVGFGFYVKMKNSTATQSLDIHPSTRPKEPLDLSLKTPAAVPHPVLAQPVLGTSVDTTLPVLLDYRASLEEEDPAPGEFLPYGTVVACTPVFGIATAPTEVPVIGITIEDQKWESKVIIPAGSHVSAFAEPSPLRDRLLARASWTIRLPDGRALKNVVAYALDNAVNPRTGQVPVANGTIGIPGTLFRAPAWGREKVEAIILAAAEAAVGSLEQTTPTILGSVAKTTGKNVAVEALRAAIAVQAKEAFEKQRIREAQENYVLVPGGKPLFLFIAQELDLRTAKRLHHPVQASSGTGAHGSE